MKTLTAFLLLLATAMPSLAGVAFTTFSTWADAQNEAAKQGKYLFVDAMTDWCGWCKVMDKRTFSDESVAAIMNSKFVCTKVEMETGWGIDLAMKYRVTSFPQFLVFNPQGELVYRMVGFLPADKFLPELERAQAPLTQHRSPGITSNFDLPWPDFLRAAFAKGKAKVMPTKETVAAWLDKQSDPTTEVAFTALVKGPLTPKWQEWFAANQAKLSSLYGNEATEKVLEIAMERGTAALEKNDDAALRSALALIPAHHPNRNDATIYLVIEQHVRKNDWKGAMAFLKAEQDAGRVHPNVANQYCWRAYEETMDHDACLLAAEIMEKTDKGTDYALWDTYAAVLFKAGKMDKAAEVARKAIQFGEKEGADVKTTRELLEAISAKP